MLKHTIMLAAVAGLVLALAPAAQAGTILVGDLLNPGLVLGDTFRLVFVTSTKTLATSTDIGYYNTFVDDVANNVTVANSIVVSYGWTWKAIASTQTKSAINNTSTTGTGFPIYLVGGGNAQVADDYVDLWNGSLDNPVTRNQTGNNELTTGENNRVWTGTNSKQRPCSK